MKVQLRIAKGPSAGRLLTLGGPEFVIGRAEECHLRPNSEAVSRRHCIIRVDDTGVSIEDLGSRNGSLVNGKRVEGTQILRNGDQLVVGPLGFELVLELDSPAKAAMKRVDQGQVVSATPEPELGARTASTGQMASVIADWLDEAPTDSEQSTNETKVFNFDDTSRLPVAKVSSEVTKQEAMSSTESVETKKNETMDNESKAPAQRKPDMRPRKPDSAKDSQEAAAQMLKKLFRSGNR